MNKQYYVYMMTNENNTVLYIGVTNDLKRRVFEHKSRTGSVFTKKYRATKLVYYEPCENIEGAISREKKLKGSSRLRKVRLINGFNKPWRELYDDF
jgi:putative endonuclease